jgi:signal transduction histidine kinase
MDFKYILLIIVFSYFRKTLQSKILLPKTDTYLFVGFWLSIVLLFSGIVLKSSGDIIGWVAYIMLIGIIYLSLTQKEYKPVKPFVYSILPFVAISFIRDITALVSLKFHDEWKGYFETAIAFSVIWFFAMFFINKKQRKDIEKEQLKAIEREKEFQQSEALKAKLEIQVAERTAELRGQKDQLQKTLDELKATQDQLIQSEKMASLGELTAGIAHEIQNPLNFVNNFSEVNQELLEEMKEEIEKGNMDEVKLLVKDVIDNEKKINHHGKRADAIVKGMLQHSRTSSGVKEPTDINALADEYLRLAYHGLRAKDKSFNVTMITDFDENLSADKADIGKIKVVPQDIGRVILNLITNAFYAVDEKKKTTQTTNGLKYEPTVSVTTSYIPPSADGGRRGAAIISVSDNGSGIPQAALGKIFQPFFTTKPSGQGTGLGLSMSYEIVTKGHGGELKVENKPGEGATFTIVLPV